MRRLILKSFQSPGDVLMLTAAVRDLHAARPGQFQTDVRTSAADLWLNNPHITPLDERTPGVETIEMHYPLVHQSNQRPYHFLFGYVKYLEERLNLSIPLTRFAGDIHLSDEEKEMPVPGAEQGVPERFWIVMAGGKYDFTAKWWDPAAYQKVVEWFHCSHLAPRDVQHLAERDEYTGEPTLAASATKRPAEAGTTNTERHGGRSLQGTEAGSVGHGNAKTEAGSFGHVQFVQCGEGGHWHPPLRGVINLVGKTSLREFVRLVYHAEGVLCPVTLAMHLAAAVETRPGRPKSRACVVVAGGREPTHWEAYPTHQYIGTVGALACCATGGCWKSRCQTVGDGDQKDHRDLCERPVQISPELRIPQCLHMITPQDVIRRIEMYCQGREQVGPACRAGQRRSASGAYFEQSPSAGNGQAVGPEAGSFGHVGQAASLPEERHGGRSLQEAGSPTVMPTKNMLIEFRHGLGDAVQLTVVLRHLARLRPDWHVDVAALLGKHSAYAGLCRKAYVLDRDPIDRSRYDEVHQLDWPECVTCYSDSPSTKAERCLREVFSLTPQADLWRYVVQPSPEDRELARRYLQRDVRAAAGEDGKYPIVLIHYEGNTSTEKKNLSHDIARRLCDEVLRAGHIPVILDWDRRSGLPDGQRIFNPHCELELWRGHGTGDAGVIAALIELSALFVGVDSGPLHVAAALTTPTIAVWTAHHPLHYLCPADHVVHLVPPEHERLLRGERAAGRAFFERHYRLETYDDLGESLARLARERLCPSDGTLVFTRSFWIRTNNADQDLVVVNDVAERDAYHIDELPMPRPVVVDVGAHIGCFAARLHQRNPLARIIALECCPENMAALNKNVGGFATIVQAAVTYEKDVGLLNAVFPNCVSTGGSTVASRAEIQRRLAAGELAPTSANENPKDYWADLRTLRTLTLEEVARQHGIDEIEVLKLDCEGSEFSILDNTSLLPRIKLIIGEYHGRAAFRQLVERRFADWELRILKDGELGTFWLQRPLSLCSRTRLSAAS